MWNRPSLWPLFLGTSAMSPLLSSSSSLHWPPIESNHRTSATVLPHSWWILCRCQYKAPDNIQNNSRDSLANLYGRPSLLFCHGRPSCSGVLISSIAPKEVWRIILCWSHSIVSHQCMQTTISNQSGNHANQYPACKFCKHFSVVRFWAFSKGDIVAGCHLKVLCHVRESSGLTEGRRGRLLKAITLKMTHPFSVSWGRRVCSQRSGLRWIWSEELDTISFVHMVQRCLAAAGYHSGNPVQCPRLTLDYRLRATCLHTDTRLRPPALV